MPSAHRRANPAAAAAALGLGLVALLAAVMRLTRRRPPVPRRPAWQPLDD